MCVFCLFVCLFICVAIVSLFFPLMLLLLYTLFPSTFLLFIHIKKGSSSPFYLYHILSFCPKLYWPGYT